MVPPVNKTQIRILWQVYKDHLAEPLGNCHKFQVIQILGQGRICYLWPLLPPPLDYSVYGITEKNYSGFFLPKLK